MNITPIPEYLTSKFNNCNYYCFRPYILLNDTEINLNKKWFEKQDEKFKELLLIHLEKYNIIFTHDINCEQYNDINKSDTMSDIEWSIYHMYLHNFDYSKWHTEKLVPRVSMVDLDLVKIKEVSTNCCFYHSDIDFEISKIQSEFDKIEPILSKYSGPVFVRLNQMSAKNDCNLEPLTNTKSILSQITNSKKIYSSVYKKDLDVKLIIMPWKEINPKYEFRVFIYNKRIVGISQQHLYDKYNYLITEITNIIEVIKKSDFIDNLIYQDVVCDVFIDERTNICHLIECNPYGPYSASGSSLFCWIKDRKILSGCCDIIEFRFSI